MKYTDLDQLFDGAKEIITRAEAMERGLKRYFTGKPCKYGHYAERLVTSAACCECQKDNNAIRYENNKNVIKERMVAYYNNNRAARIEYSIKRRRENPDHVKQINRRSWKKHGKKYTIKSRSYRYQWAKSNKDKVSLYNSNWGAKNSKKKRELTAAWCALNPEKVRANKARRHSRKRGAINLSCADITIQKYRKNGGLCFYCSTEVAPADVHCDHVIPLAKQGPHAGINLVLACAPCNLSKGAHSPSTWRKLPEKHRRRALNREQKVLAWVEKYNSDAETTLRLDDVRYSKSTLTR